MIIPAGVTVGLTQSLFKAYEGDKSVEVCAELMQGTLGTNLSLTLEADGRNQSTGTCICQHEVCNSVTMTQATPSFLNHITCPPFLHVILNNWEWPGNKAINIKL